MYTNQFRGITRWNVFLNKSLILFYTFDLRWGRGDGHNVQAGSSFSLS